MDVLRFGVISGELGGKLRITGFTFINGSNYMANDPNYVIPAVIRSIRTAYPEAVIEETFSDESEMIVLKAIQKARHSK